MRTQPQTSLSISFGGIPKNQRKPSELFDTFFIVIHKKPLIFLHWYHHISVLFYCWHSYVTKNPVGIIFCVMNYAVHSFMYFYYFLMAAHMKPKSFNAVYITLAQISQMVVGCCVTLGSIYLLWFDPVIKANNNTENQCHLEQQNVLAALVMYGSYLALFLEFFIERYFKNAAKSSAKKLSSSTSSNGHYQNGSSVHSTKVQASRRKED